MFETAIICHGSPTLCSDVSDRCLVCEQSAEPGVNDLIKCSFCLQYWHPACALRCKELVQNFLVSNIVTVLPDLGLTPETMPFIFWPGAQVFIQG